MSDNLILIDVNFLIRKVNVYIFSSKRFPLTAETPIVISDFTRGSSSCRTAAIVTELHAVVQIHETQEHRTTLKTGTIRSSYMVWYQQADVSAHQFTFTAFPSTQLCEHRSQPGRNELVCLVKMWDVKWFHSREIIIFFHHSGWENCFLSPLMDCSHPISIGCTKLNLCDVFFTTVHCSTTLTDVPVHCTLCGKFRKAVLKGESSLDRHL